MMAIAVCILSCVTGFVLCLYFRQSLLPFPAQKRIKEQKHILC